LHLQLCRVKAGHAASTQAQVLARPSSSITWLAPRRIGAWGCGDDGGKRSDAALDGGYGMLDRAIRVDAGAGCKTFVADSLIDHACFHELAVD
jgi:hypothetical protein